VLGLNHQRLAASIRSAGLGLVIVTLTACDRTGDDPVAPALDDHELRHAFVPNPDVGGGTELPCSLFLQNCPAGEKCMPWANDGGDSYNATRCAEVDPEPGAPGMPCTVQLSVYTGSDDCERGAICLGVEPETLEGTCWPFATGSSAHPICVDALHAVRVAASSPLTLCIPTCRPLLGDCPEDLGCYPIDGTFSCAPNASADIGDVGEPCEFRNVCNPGLACVAADDFSDCGSAGCCTPYCDTTAPACPDGLNCQPWSSDSTLPPGNENLGMCLG